MRIGISLNWPALFHIVIASKTNASSISSLRKGLKLARQEVVRLGERVIAGLSSEA